MMKIKVGAFGNELVFRVSDKSVMTFKSMSRTVSGKWSSMDRIGQKPLPYFQGPDLQSINMEIVLDAALGVRPRSMLQKIEKMIESGQAETLIIGRRRVGGGRWVITKSSEAWDIVLQKGELFRATVRLTLQEYC